MKKFILYNKEDIGLDEYDASIYLEEEAKDVLKKNGYDLIEISVDYLTNNKKKKYNSIVMKNGKKYPCGVFYTTDRTKDYVKITAWIEVVDDE